MENSRTTEEWTALLHETYFDGKDHWATLTAHDPGLGGILKRDLEEAKRLIFRRLCAMRPDTYGYEL